MRTVKTVAADNLTPMHHQPIKTADPVGAISISRRQDQQHRKPVDHWFVDVSTRGGGHDMLTRASPGEIVESGDVKCPVEIFSECLHGIPVDFWAGYTFILVKIANSRRCDHIGTAMRLIGWPLASDNSIPSSLDSRRQQRGTAYTPSGSTSRVSRC